MNVKKAAVVGLGNMGRHHARNFTEISGVDLVAICDHSQDTLDLYGKQFNARGYLSLEEMLRNEEIDMVSLVTPTSTHFDNGKIVLEAGCHLLIEKPIAQTLEEAETLIDLANSKGLCLSVGHIERFNPVIARLHEIIRSKDCGELKSLVSKRVGPYPKQIKDMNVVIDLAVHDIDLFAFLLDRQPLHVSGHSGFANLDSHQDYASIFLDYGDLSGFIQVSWISPMRQRSLELQFTEAYLEVDYVAQQIVKYTQDAQGDPHKEVIQISPLEPLKEELTHFLHCIDHPSESIISGKVGLDSLKIALMV